MTYNTYPVFVVKNEVERGRVKWGGIERDGGIQEKMVFCAAVRTFPVSFVTSICTVYRYIASLFNSYTLIVVTLKLIATTPTWSLTVK